MFAPGFARRLNERYRKRLAGETLMVNELYLSLVYRPATNAAQRFTVRCAVSAAMPSDEAREWADSIDVCQKLGETVRTALDVYEPEALGTLSASGSTLFAAAGIFGFARQWRVAAHAAAAGAGE